MTHKIILDNVQTHNLKHLSLRLPHGKLIAVVGVSGSGKSSLVFNTIAADATRQLNEAYPAFIRNRLPRWPRPDVERIEGLTATILVDQKPLGTSVRSTLGTATDLGALTRLLYSRAARPDPGPSSHLSFNDPAGMCPRCEGLGFVRCLDLDRFLDVDLSLADGAIGFSSFRPGSYRWKRYILSGLFDPKKPLRDYSEAEWDTLLYSTPIKPPHPLPGWHKTALYEGLVPRFDRAYLREDGAEATAKAAEIAAVTSTGQCPECGGSRLAEAGRSCTLKGMTLPQLWSMPLRLVAEKIDVWVKTLGDQAIGPVLKEISSRVTDLVDAGLGYLSLDRASGTLSGGEAQRVKLVRRLSSSLTGMTYVLDEPGTGLHPRDIAGIIRMLRRLRDRGNTVIVVEHNLEVIRAADQVIELGPGAGVDGGRLLFQGSPRKLVSRRTPTGRALARHPSLNSRPRTASGWLEVRDARTHNLRGFDVDIPLGVLVTVTGVAGSGKSSLIRGDVVSMRPDAVVLDQKPMKPGARSSVGSYLGMTQQLQASFARRTGADPAMLNNHAAGACPECRGKGTVTLDLAFMEPVKRMCEACDATGFCSEALVYQLDGRNIAQLMDADLADVEEAFPDSIPVLDGIRRLRDVGLGYLRLGRATPTLSGGERLRLRVARQLKKTASLYIFDEPTAGLHTVNVASMIALMESLVEGGASVIAIEHSMEVAAASDWILDIGPGAGADGGSLLFSGTPEQLVGSAPSAESSATAAALRAAVDPFGSAATLAG